MVKFDNIRPPQADPPKIGNSKQSTITLDELYVNATRVDNYCDHRHLVYNGSSLLTNKTRYFEHPGSDTHRRGGLYFYQFSIYIHWIS